MPSGISIDRGTRMTYLCVVDLARDDVRWVGSARMHMKEGARLRWRPIKQGVHNAIDLTMKQANGFVVKCDDNACTWYCEIVVKKRLNINLD